MQRLTDKNFLITPPADNDVVHTVDVSNITADPAGTSFKQEISVHRTHGNNQNTTFNNVATLGPSGANLRLDFISPAVFFRVRDNSSANILTIAESSGAVIIENNLSIASGDFNINTGDAIIQNGSLNVQSGGADFNGNVDMNGFRIENLLQITSNNPFFISVTNANAGISMVGAGTTIQLLADTVNVGTGDLNVAGDFRLQAGGVLGRVGAADPTPADIAAGHHAGWYNSGANEFRIWYNNAGVMQSTAVFT